MASLHSERLEPRRMTTFGSPAAIRPSPQMRSAEWLGRRTSGLRYSLDGSARVVKLWRLSIPAY
ncbi:MAG TPA: hypothetical protein VFQ90_02305, partial [Stellaceae bacterium]|nr:hypothetical protein [Stellaceae bacterium]